MMLYAIIGTLIGVSVLWIVFRLTKKAQIEPKYSCGYYYSPKDEAEKVLIAINEERYISSIYWELSYCQELEITAQLCANYLNGGGEWSHKYFREIIVPNKTKKYPDIHIGEILAKGYDSLDSLMKAWMESDSHRRLIMFPRYECMGYAHIGKFYVVHFAYEKLKQ